MKLKDYLIKNKISITEFSRQLEHSRPHLSKVINGRLIPSLYLAKIIERETKGEVKIIDLIPPKNP